MKRLTTLLICLVAAVTAGAHDFSATAPTGQTLYYTVTGDDSVRIEAPTAGGWGTYAKPTGALAIPATVAYGGTTYTVAAIYRNAFAGCTALTEVIVAGSVEYIGTRAFAGDTLLERAILKPGVQSIDMMAFSGCTRLGCIELPASINRIAAAAFLNTAYYRDTTNWSTSRTLNLGRWVLSQATSHEGTLRIHNGIVGLANSTLLDCDKLTLVDLPATLQYLGEGTFLNCHALDTLRLRCPTPPATDKTTFQGIGTLVVAVPCGTAADYTGEPWSAFTIVEDPCDTTPHDNYDTAATRDLYHTEGIGQAEPVPTPTVVSTPDGVEVTGTEGRRLQLFDIVGHPVATLARAAERQRIALPATGIYVLVADGCRPVKISYCK